MLFTRPAGPSITHPHTAYTRLHSSLVRTPPRYVYASAAVVALALLYVVESSFRVLPDSWAQTGAYQAVIGMSPAVGQEDGPTVDVWRQTRYLSGVAGITSWENVYLHNGTFYVVGPNQTLPETGHIMTAKPTDDNRYDAKDDRWRVIDRESARRVMGTEAILRKGITIFHNDEGSTGLNSFLGHYYHFAEVFLAAWRLTTSQYGSSTSIFPSRIMFRVGSDDWQDRAGLTTWLLGAMMPKTMIEDKRIWEERAASGQTYLFEKIEIIDRFSAHRHGGEMVQRWGTMTMDILDLQAPADWMVPLQGALRQYLNCKHPARTVPVVTYLNRQKTGRRLRDKDAESLKLELEKLEQRGEIVLHDQFFEDISAKEQFCLIFETDILLGVHGNGLTHQMWMKRGSAVIEIMGEGGFAMVYPWLGKVMGHEYNVVHNDHIYPESEWTRPDGSHLNLDGDFNTDHIRVSGSFIADLVGNLVRRRKKSSDRVAQGGG